MISNNYSGHEAFDNSIPSIFQIQDLIEAAWAKGYGLSGMVETGGIRGTRKYIGTPEVIGHTSCDVHSCRFEVLTHRHLGARSVPQPWHSVCLPLIRLQLTNASKVRGQGNTERFQVLAISVGRSTPLLQARLLD